MHHCQTYTYINFQQNRISRSVKTVHTNVFAKNCNLQLDFQKPRLSDMHYLITDIQTDFEIIPPIRYQITAKINYIHRRSQTDMTSRTCTIMVFPVIKHTFRVFTNITEVCGPILKLICNKCIHYTNYITVCTS